MPLRLSIDYGKVAERYDNSRGVEPSIIANLAAGLRSLGASSLIEIGSGTGNYTAALLARGFHVTALEPAHEMIMRGRAKAATRWLRADAHRLPLHDGAVDAATAVNVLHHLADLPTALGELFRVTTRGAVLQAVVRENLESLWYRHYFPAIDSRLLPLHPTLGALVTAALRAGFARVESATIFYSGGADLTFEAARTRPRLLFDADFRAATSGFRRLPAHAIELGLARLESDLASGDFDAIARRYEAEHASVGDCVVLTAAHRALH
ncbi:MAG TPA: class I SAM-dependent methyltransferase [Candidatus Binataceae bacterium]